MSESPLKWFQEACADLKKAETMLKQDPDLAAFLAWQSARKALKALEKKSGKRVSTSSLAEILESFPEGKLAGKPVRDAAKYLDLFKGLARHNDLFSSGLTLGPLGPGDARRLIDAARLILNFLEHRIV